jgi:hypothetical protein
MDDRKLTDSEMDKIAEMAANKAFDKFHAAVGRSVLKKSAWVLSGVIIAVVVFLQEGIVK